MDVVVTVGETPFGGALRGLLSAVGERGRRSDAMAFLQSPYSGIDASTVAALDASWRRHGVTSASRMLAHVARDGHAAEAIAAAHEAVSAPAAPAALPVWKKLADTLLEASLGTRGRGPGGVSGAELLDAAVHRSILSAVRESCSLGVKLSGGELAAGLADVPVGRVYPDRRGAVQMLDATNARERRFDVVIIGGLTAAEFSAERPEPLQARLERMLGGRGGTEERLAERMLFYTLATRARERLVLVRTSSDAAGESVRPSVFWEELIDLYAGTGADGETGPPPAGLKQTSLLLSNLSEAVPAFSAQRRDLRRRVETGEAGLTRPLSVALHDDQPVLKRDSFTVTELETYALCPYRWFVEKALRPREIDAALDAREMGTRAHEMLAVFYRSLPDRLGLRRVDPANLEECLTLFDELADGVEAERQVWGSMTLAQELDMATARRRARSIVEGDAEFLPGYAPSWLEWEFSAEIDLDGGATVRGKIDRIDEGPDGLVISDYKLSQALGRGSWQSNVMLQIPLYADIAAQELSVPIVGGVYRSLKTGDARGFWLVDIVPLGEGRSHKDATDETGLAEMIEWARATAGAAVEGIRDGLIEPNPAHRRACGTCLAAAFCPKAVR